MGALQDRINLSKLVFGKDIVDYYKNNTLYMYDLYSKSEELCKSISISEILPGRFHFFHYQDPSNWMQYSPVFVVNFKKVNNFNVIIALNFNFIPLEIRGAFFDRFITEKDFEKNNDLKVDYKGIYDELFKLGFEYALVEYNAIQLKLIHRIHLDLLPRFLYSSHPKNTYDPLKLMEIWKTKIDTKLERHDEISSSLLSDFFKVEEDINEKYKILKGHIQRLQNSYEKFKNK